MKNEQKYETKRIDHLGIVGGICQEIGLIEKVNEAVGVSKRKVSCGATVQAMVLNSLGFSNRALYLTPQYWQNKAVDVLVSPELRAEDLNDDTLGRSLDQLYEAGVTEVFAKVSQQALEVYGITHQFYHLDSSSFSLQGQYAGEQGEEEAIKINYGYSKDHRPDLKQVVLNLITGHRSKLPVWMEALSGNSSDKKSFPETIQAFCQQLKAEKYCYFVVDSALYSADNLKSLDETRWLTRVPETLTDAKRLVTETQAEQMTVLADDYAYLEQASDYGGVTQRWLLVYSPLAAQREEKTLLKRVEKEKKIAQKAWRRLAAQTFNCQKDAQLALAQIHKRWPYHRLEAVATPITRFPAPGRPATDAKPDVIGFQLQGDVFLSETNLAQAKQCLGRFVLATNELDPLRLSSEAMLAEYKAQTISVERGFRFLKDPIFFAHSLFLKNPSRIMALLMVMILALLVYALAERKLRLQLTHTGLAVPNQVGKDTQTPTMRWIFQLFEGIDLLIIRHHNQVVHRQILNLRPEHLIILRLLGPPIQNCYFLSS